MSPLTGDDLIARGDTGAEGHVQPAREARTGTRGDIEVADEPAEVAPASNVVLPGGTLGPSETFSVLPIVKSKEFRLYSPLPS
jgi:hypothetical protein